MEITNFIKVKLKEVKEKEWATINISTETSLRENGEMMRNIQATTNSSQAILLKVDSKTENYCME